MSEQDSQIEDVVDQRDDGPFDLDEVDLDGDGVERIDFGAVIATPLRGMDIHMQVDPETRGVPAVLATFADSALELALFAAPRGEDPREQMFQDMRDEALAMSGTAELAPGPFGDELRREVKLTAPDGSTQEHISRTWLASGPRWVLRGTVMGRAAVEISDELTEPLLEFFKNTVVVRGTDARPSGDLIPLTLPEGTELVEQG